MRLTDRYTAQRWEAELGDGFASTHDAGRLLASRPSQVIARPAGSPGLAEFRALKRTIG